MDPPRRRVARKALARRPALHRTAPPRTNAEVARPPTPTRARCRPLPPAGSSAVMLSLTVDTRVAVDAMNDAAAAHGGRGDANPVQDLGFMYGRDIADPDDHLWGAVWMDPAASPTSAASASSAA